MKGVAFGIFKLLDIFISNVSYNFLISLFAYGML